MYTMKSIYIRTK